jgi:hypothetical protein
MKHSANKFQTVSCNIVLAFLSVHSLAGCSGGNSGTTDTTPSSKWVEVSYVNSSTTTASLSGTAWVNNDYYASRCVGWECLIDNQRTNYFPGVTLTCQNQTTGESGNATSYYGPGTNWQHEWYASVPIISGTNTIQISAFDPGGKRLISLTSFPPIRPIRRRSKLAFVIRPAMPFPSIILGRSLREISFRDPLIIALHSCCIC